METRLLLSCDGLIAERIDSALAGISGSSVYGSKLFSQGIHEWTVRIQNLRTLFGFAEGMMAVAFGVAPDIMQYSNKSHWNGYGWDTAGFCMRGDGERHAGGLLAKNGEMLITLKLKCNPVGNMAVLVARDETGSVSIRDVPLPVRPFFVLGYQTNKISISNYKYSNSDSEPMRYSCTMR